MRDRTKLKRQDIAALRATAICSAYVAATTKNKTKAGRVDRQELHGVVG